MERRSATRAVGPEDSHAALAMGNSVKAWSKFYDKFALRRDSGQGVEMMGDWRLQMLEREVADVPALDAVMRSVVKAANPDSDDDDTDVELM